MCSCGVINNNNNTITVLFGLWNRLLFCDCCAVIKKERAEGKPVGARRAELIEPAMCHYHCAVPVQITQLDMRY
jgi:hypothetical protein